MSIDVKPWTALVTVPAFVVSSGGRAKYARKASDMPSRMMRGPAGRRSLTSARSRVDSRGERAVDDLAGHLAHPGARAHRGALDEGERVAFAHRGAFDEQSL